MAAVHVTTTNPQGQTATLLLDDERDAERIEFLHSLRRREVLDSVEVTEPGGKARKGRGKAADADAGADEGEAG